MKNVFTFILYNDIMKIYINRHFHKHISDIYNSVRVQDRLILLYPQQKESSGGYLQFIQH